MTENVTDQGDNHPIIVFTDLDGTLLDHFSYSFEPALPAIGALQSRHIPWILSSSKTRAELVELRKLLNNTWPFIFENGGGVGFDSSTWCPPGAISEHTNEAQVKTFGRARTEILDVLETLKDRFRFRGFNDMDQTAIMQTTGLDSRRAQLAGQREFTEPLQWLDSEKNLHLFKCALNEAGLRCLIGGRFVHVMGYYDKAESMSWLIDNLPGIGPQTRVIALGDSNNDIEMLQRADLGVVIKSPVHEFPDLHTNHTVIYTEQLGPVGWNSALLGILEDL